VVAALGDVARSFGHVVRGATVADQAGLSSTRLGAGLAIIRLASLRVCRSRAGWPVRPAQDAVCHVRARRARRAAGLGAVAGLGDHFCVAALVVFLPALQGLARFLVLPETRGASPRTCGRRYPEPRSVVACGCTRVAGGQAGPGGTWPAGSCAGWPRTGPPGYPVIQHQPPPDDRRPHAEDPGDLRTWIEGPPSGLAGPGRGLAIRRGGLTGQPGQRPAAAPLGAARERLSRSPHGRVSAGPGGGPGWPRSWLRGPVAMLTAA
jgi:hypothetical protein